MYKIAYDEAKAVCSDQVAELDSMRQRSVQFLAFAGSATGFLVGAGLRDVPASQRSWDFFALAGTASLASLASILYVSFILLALIPDSGQRKRFVRPRRLHSAVWNFQMDADRFVTGWIDPEVGAPSEMRFYRDLALHYGEKAQENEPQLDTIRAWYLRFVIAASAQVVAWAAVIWIYA
jgi:hypothetical protein